MSSRFGVRILPSARMRGPQPRLEFLRRIEMHIENNSGPLRLEFAPAFSRKVAVYLADQ